MLYMLHMKHNLVKKQYYTKKIGNKAEDLACVLLNNLGYKIIARNFYRKVGEIDVVAVKEAVYHFVEVKGVTHETPWDFSHEKSIIYRPEDRINKTKIHKIYKTANLFLLEQGVQPPVEAQIDLVTVSFYKSGDVPRLDIIENIS